jgi:hypothetical protein
LDAVCGDGEQAEDFCDHGVGILAGLVGQRRGEQFFLRIFFGMIARRWTERLPRWVMPMAMRNGSVEDLAAVVDFFVACVEDDVGQGAEWALAPLRLVCTIWSWVRLRLSTERSQNRTVTSQASCTT